MSTKLEAFELRTVGALEWADALESGKFTQIPNILESLEGNCCLGVYAILAGVPESYRRYYFDHNLRDNEECSLLRDVSIDLDKQFELMEIGVETEYSHMNDTQGKSFKEIALEIRKRIEKRNKNYYLTKTKK